MAADPSSLEGKYQLLLRKHANLVEAIRQKNDRVSDVEDQVASLTEEKSELEERLLQVNRILEGLCLDIETISARLHPGPLSTPATSLGPTPGLVEEDALARYLLRPKDSGSAARAGMDDACAPSTSAPTPGLGGSKLARKASTCAASPTAGDRPDTPHPDAETEFTARSARALQSLASLLEVVQRVVASGEGAADVAKSLSASDALQAELRSASAAARRYRDDCVRLELQCRDLEHTAQERQEDILALQRKVFKLTKQVDEGMSMNTLMPPVGQNGAFGVPSLVPAVAMATASPAPPSVMSGPEGVFQAKVLADYRAQVSDLMEQVARLEADLKLQREGALRTKTEAAQVLSEREGAWETEKAALRRQLADVTLQLTTARGEAQMLRSERSLLEALRAETGRLVAAVEAPSRHMPPEWASLERQLQEQALLLQQRSQATVQLASLNHELTQDLDHRRAEQERTRVKAEALQAALEEAQTARQLLAVKETELSRATERLAELEGCSKSTSSRERQLQGRVKDLQAFVEVLTTMTGEDMEFTEVRAQRKRLEERVRALETQLAAAGVPPLSPSALDDSGRNGNGAGAGAASVASSAQVEALKQERDDAVAAADRLRTELESERASLAETRERLRSAEFDVDIYMKEMESIAATYDKAQAKNSQLAQRMADHEKEAVGVMQTKLALVKQAAKAAEERDAAKRALDAASTQAQHLAQQLAEAAQREGELLVRVRELEVQRGQDRIESEGALRGEREAWAAERRDLKRKLDKAASESEEEKSKRRRLAEERDSLQLRVDKLRDGKQALERVQGGSTSGGAGAGATGSGADEELRSLRRLINCSVCHENPKGVMLMKCQHLFCQSCVQARISSRDRKCPGCGVKFAENDVKPFFFT